MSALKRPGPGSVVLIVEAILGLFAYAYPGAHPALQTAARIVFWVLLLVLAYWAFQWIRERRRARRVIQGQAHLRIGVPVISAVGTVLAPTIILASHWHTGCSTALGPALPHRKDLEGLLIFLNHDDKVIPDGEYLCDVLIDGHRANARFLRSPTERKQLSAVYPTEFTGGTTVPLPLPPGVHSAAWRETQGATSTFLTGLEITVSSQGKVDWKEVHDDPMKG